MAPTNTDADLVKLDGSTGWDRPNSGYHDVAGDRSDMVGGAVASGEFPLFPAFSPPDPLITQARLGSGDSSHCPPMISRLHRHQGPVHPHPSLPHPSLPDSNLPPSARPPQTSIIAGVSIMVPG
jgi:hypothetical protein